MTKQKNKFISEDIWLVFGKDMARIFGGRWFLNNFKSPAQISK